MKSIHCVHYRERKFSYISDYHLCPDICLCTLISYFVTTFLPILYITLSHLFNYKLILTPPLLCEVYSTLWFRLRHWYFSLNFTLDRVFFTFCQVFFLGRSLLGPCCLFVIYSSFYFVNEYPCRFFVFSHQSLVPSNTEIPRLTHRHVFTGPPVKDVPRSWIL